MVAVEIHDLTVEYRDGNRSVSPIDGFSLSLDSGQLVLLVGPSGSGKTSLLSCLAGILTPTRGRVMVDGTDITALDAVSMTSHRRHTVGIVFQAFNLVASLSARENVAMPLIAAGVAVREALARAEVLLSQVDMAHRRHHRPGELSGGQQQRVAIARALAHDPPLLLADEPTAHLDHVQAEGVLRILRTLAGPGRLVIVSTHDQRLEPIADAVIDLAPFAELVVDVVRTVRLSPGDVLFRQGDPSDLVWVVRSGSVVVEREDGDGPVERLATCGVGEYVGELGPLLGFPRSATVRAEASAEVEGFDVRTFRAAMAGKMPSSWGGLARVAR